MPTSLPIVRLLPRVCCRCGRPTASSLVMLKMDFLGLKTLSIIDRCLELVKKRFGTVNGDPDFDIEMAVAYTEVAMRRAAEVGIKVTVLGSGWARSYPEGFSRDEAERQFVTLLKRMGAIAKKYGVVIAIEPLRKQECNFINTVQEGYEIAKKVGSPNVKVNADIYHMMQEGESPQSLINAGRKYIANVHIAENARRTPPGTDGDDFTPYFRALKKIKYNGSISIECGWGDFAKQLKPAIQEVQRQLLIAYGE